MSGKLCTDLDTITFGGIDQTNDLLTVYDYSAVEDKKIAAVEFLKRSLASTDVSWATALTFSGFDAANDKLVVFDTSATQFKTTVLSEVLNKTFGATSVSSFSSLTRSAIAVLSDKFPVWDASASVWKLLTANELLDDPNVINVKNAAYGATGDGVTDDYAAIAAAIAAGGDGKTFFFPAGEYRHSAELKFEGNYQHVLGDGGNATYLTFTGSSGNQVTFGKVGKGYVSYFCSMERISLKATNTTNSKIALQLVDQAEFNGYDLNVLNELGANTVGVCIRGRQHTTLTHCYLGAPVPLQIGNASESTPAGWLSADFLRCQQMELISNAAPTTFPRANILVGEYSALGALDTSKPSHLSNAKFDTISMIGARYGLHWVALTVPSGKYSHTVVFDNCRKEQTTGASPWAFYVNVPTATDLGAGSHALWGLQISNFQGDFSGGVGGIYARGIEHLRLEEFNNYGGSSTTVDVDDVGVMTWDGVYQASSSTCTFGSNMKMSHASMHRNGYPYPTHAVWVTQSQYVNALKPTMRIGDTSEFRYAATMADDAIAYLPINADVQYVTSCLLEVWMTSAAGGSLAEYGIFLLTPATAGTNGVVKLAGSSINVDVADTDTKLCVFCSGSALTGNLAVKNRLGASVSMALRATYMRSVNT